MSILMKKIIFNYLSYYIFGYIDGVQNKPPKYFCIKSQNYNCQKKMEDSRSPLGVTEGSLLLLLCLCVCMLWYRISWRFLDCGKLFPVVMCHVPVLIEKPSSAQNAVLFIYLEKNNLSAIAAAPRVNDHNHDYDKTYNWCWCVCRYMQKWFLCNII